MIFTCLICGSFLKYNMYKLHPIITVKIAVKIMYGSSFIALKICSVSSGVLEPNEL